MKAIGYQKSLPIENELSLQDIELETPTAHGHDILVEVKAVSVNPVDFKIRQAMPAAEGEYKVIGWDATGVVKSVGENVSLFKPGDKVWYAGDITRSGSNAQFQLVDERIVGHMPSSLSYGEAAALPLTSITAWELLFDRLNVAKNDDSKSILVIGAAGGVGSIMVQLLKQRTKLNIIASASRAETISWLEDLGADTIVNHRNPLSEEFAAKNLSEVDYVVSLNNTEQHLPEIEKVVKPQGQFALIDDPETLNIVPFKNKSVSVHWELMFTRSLFKTDDMQEQHVILNNVATMIDQGQIKTTVGEHLGKINAANLRKAHQHLESQTAKGKVVLEGF
ncbi:MULTISPECIES: zinc-binding alcohol dehydrogenase family protein [Pseudoalteromonas]|jgi:zinc-binding alcohol dehydrogenase family protein|uniref:Zinc-type alcohol dehydrogenase-like protein n=1 Tax=Pseudoalteromonas atlantica TaxID=288 RepID=A0ABQ0UIG0_PSEAF|nr:MULTISPECIES: zinc-binding alcohol dehydrogenase family protein [Pseudoalteromonas]MCP4060052.1 zinc-binding alcohol dehydrogenase family protein [Pseudoalteromonas sp.]MDY6888758.1 zinc-binding alcohol dehydrogenase family protein [Pseudomonadota bacterium]GEK78250.1 oxidoreductase [Pseudoalteromonas atlantica]MCK8117289.1 zinc-binding alcohol dehydrogenase family protein [Pseudoalteromonas sp. 2CM37A]MDC9499156.1 zinc-binding alcohol dehydrogenase family protein [Pseudoalteromonas sp. Ang